VDMILDDEVLEIKAKGELGERFGGSLPKDTFLDPKSTIYVSTLKDTNPNMFKLLQEFPIVIKKVKVEGGFVMLVKSIFPITDDVSATFHAVLEQKLNDHKEADMMSTLAQMVREKNARKNE
jgi:hypothetical protein